MVDECFASLRPARIISKCAHESERLNCFIQNSLLLMKCSLCVEKKCVIFLHKCNWSFGFCCCCDRSWYCHSAYHPKMDSNPLPPLIFSMCFPLVFMVFKNSTIFYKNKLLLNCKLDGYVSADDDAHCVVPHMLFFSFSEYNENVNSIYIFVLCNNHVLK